MIMVIEWACRLKRLCGAQHNSIHIISFLPVSAMCRQRGVHIKLCIFPLFGHFICLFTKTSGKLHLDTGTCWLTSELLSRILVSSLNSFVWQLIFKATREIIYKFCNSYTVEMLWEKHSLLFPCKLMDWHCPKNGRSVQTSDPEFGAAPRNSPSHFMIFLDTQEEACESEVFSFGWIFLYIFQDWQVVSGFRVEYITFIPCSHTALSQ